MIKYLVILLDDTSTSFCHYNSNYKERNLINIEVLKKAVTYAMKENLIIQYVYPDYELPEIYKVVIDEMVHVNIVPVGSSVPAEAIVIDGISEFTSQIFTAYQSYVLRIDYKSFINEWKSLLPSLERISRLNIVYTDVCDFQDDDSLRYTQVLDEFSNKLKELFERGFSPQVNILTDRLFLNKMNNCNAGVECITLAPDGKLYVCPGFYYDSLGSIGSIDNGLAINNPKLYCLDHAPICRICDSYHCKRCVWLNRMTTLEVNTPSHEQCVISHIERNASRLLKHSMNNCQFYAEIPEINYLDPFDELTKRI